MSLNLAHYLASARIRLPMQGKFHTTQGQLLLTTHLLPDHRSVLLHLHPHLAMAKRHHQTKIAQISISEHMAKIEKVEEKHLAKIEKVEAKHLAYIKEVEAIWYQRTRQVEMDAKMDAKEEKDKLHGQILKIAADNSRLQTEVLQAIDEKLRMTGNFNVRGALERIVHHAKQQEIIPNSVGVQKGLNALAATEAFARNLKIVADDRRLVYDHVSDRAKRLYDEVSKHAHGNDRVITIRTKDFTHAECAALVTYLMVQREWPSHLDWIEEN